jgi:DNA recombination protein RmuC
MNWLPILAALGLGFILGLAAAFALRILHARSAKQMAQEMLQIYESQRKSQLDAVVEHLKASFGSLSLDALSKSTEEFLKLAKARLDSDRGLNAQELELKKGLIDQRLDGMTLELERLAAILKQTERDRAEKYGELSTQLRVTNEQTAALINITGGLREALASARSRGHWGERMAEDVLRLAGFIENVNFVKQKAIDRNGGRPDFTFMLPRDLKVNMDVKFPLDNYARFLEAQAEPEKARFKNEFLKDVRARIKEVATRDYINPEQNTLDYVLLFIPNEQIYSFVHEHDGSILDEGIKNRVVLCSPMTLFAVLAVIRHAIDNFALDQTSNEILSLLGAFKKRWDEFLKRMELLGKRIEDTHKEYESLSTTRRRLLEKPLDRIEQLRTQRGLPVATILEEEPFLPIEGFETAE